MMMRRFLFLLLAAAACRLQANDLPFNTHDYALVRLVLRGKSGNVLVSPKSARDAFAMLYDGSRGNSAKQLQNAFGFSYAPAGERRAESGYPEPSDDLTIRSANSLWADRHSDILPTYRTLVVKKHDGECFTEDFRRNAADAAIRINKWIEKQTNGKIDRMLDPGDVRNIELMLVNALYFNGKWQHPFDKKGTKDAKFHLADGKFETVPLMMTKNYFGYFADAQASGVILPYRGDRYDLLCILPTDNKPGALERLEKAYDQKPALLPDMLKKVRSSEVIVFLPKFKLGDKMELNDLLRELGATDIFNRHADLSGINGKRNLFVSKAMQQTIMETDETGTEAAAATTIAVARMSMMRPELFRADRPFLLFLLDRQTGSILFGGRFAAPQR